MTPSGGAALREVKVQGASITFQADPLRGQATGMDWIAEYIPSAVGTYRVEATALTPGLEVITGTTTFRVIGAGGTNEIVEGPPEVIPARTVPKTGAKGVGVSSFLQVVFTEPVRKIAGHVTLVDGEGTPVPITISGPRPHDQGTDRRPPGQPGRGGHRSHRSSRWWASSTTRPTP